MQPTNLTNEEITDEIFVLDKGIEHLNELLAIPGFKEEFRDVLKLQRKINSTRINQLKEMVCIS